ncbi:MAG: hypothetical protein KKC84_02015 [Candidatus Omnitrophica bacterium]|nr:hypothetical protein [Candidatus Omnitrophota bacterium]
MNEQSDAHEELPSAPTEQSVFALIKKMQQQLVFLEKKIDILIEQSQGKPFREKQFSRPFRSYGRPYRNSHRAQGDPSGERRFDRGRHFEKPHSEESRGFEHKKKTFDSPGERDFAPPRHFEKRTDGDKRGFVPRKKPFSFRNKDRR